MTSRTLSRKGQQLGYFPLFRAFPIPTVTFESRHICDQRIYAHQHCPKRSLHQSMKRKRHRRKHLTIGFTIRQVHYFKHLLSVSTPTRSEKDVIFPFKSGFMA